MKEIRYCLNHPEKPVKCKFLCRACYEKQLIDNNPEYKERQRQNSLKYAKKNRKKINEYNQKRNVVRGLQQSFKDTKYYALIRRTYKLSKEDYLIMLQNCDNKCILCRRPPHPGKRLHVDHDHKTGKIRGLLCTRCNWYLHTIEKDITILEKIKKYLNL